jgi:hypothetical protein
LKTVREMREKRNDANSNGDDMWVRAMINGTETEAWRLVKKKDEYATAGSKSKLRSKPRIGSVSFASCNRRGFRIGRGGAVK